ncbi:MAG: hypothetical protein Q9203_000554 [Teloschistes exilis]
MSQRRVFERASASSIRYALRSFPRTAIQRRFASDEMPKLTGAADNAFNRERMAVKQHAGESADALVSLPPPVLQVMLDVLDSLERL